MSEPTLTDSERQNILAQLAARTQKVEEQKKESLIEVKENKSFGEALQEDIQKSIEQKEEENKRKNEIRENIVKNLDFSVIEGMF